MADEILVGNIDFGEINICKGIKEMDFFDEELITGQDGPGIRVTGQDGPGMNKLITGQDEPGIKVTEHDEPGMKRLTKRNKNGHNDANEIVKGISRKF